MPCIPQSIGFAWFASRGLFVAAYQAHPAGVGVLAVLLSHVGRLGAWPTVETLCRELGRPQGDDRGAGRATVSPDTVQRALAAYTGAGILVRRRVGRGWNYTIAPRYLAELDGSGKTQQAANLHPTSRKLAADPDLNSYQEQIPLTPTPTHSPIVQSDPMPAAGGEAPPAPPLPCASRSAPGGSPPATPLPAAGSARRARPVGERPQVAVDVRVLDELLRWYAGAWAERYGRPYLADRRVDPRRLRTLLAWAVADGAADPAAWVRAYLRRFLQLGAELAIRGHELGDATGRGVRELCRPKRRPAAPTAPPPRQLVEHVEPMQAGEIDAWWCRILGRPRRAAAGA